MKTIKTTGSAGKAYGHVPGHQYHDVDVTVRQSRNGRWAVDVIETWGSAQGYDEEHGRKTVVGRGDSIAEAVRDARDRALSVDIEREYMEAAIAEAEEAAIESSAVADSSLLASLTTDQLKAELARRQ